MPPTTISTREATPSSATGANRRSAGGAGDAAAAHWDATRVMMTSVATCIRPVMPAV